MANVWGGSWGTSWGTSWAESQAPAVDTRNRGGWLSPEQLRNVRRIIREAELASHDRDELKRRIAKARIDELEAIYDRVLGIPGIEESPVAEAVAPYSVDTERAVPEAARIDWRALHANTEAVARLARAMARFVEDREEEEAVMLLLMAS